MIQETQENQLQNINEHNTSESSFEVYQEECVQYKDRVESKTKILTFILVCIELLIVYFLGKFALFLYIVVSLIGIVFIVFDSISPTTTRTYTKFPNILSVGLIFLLTALAIYKTSFFEDGINSETIVKWSLGALCICANTMCIHRFSDFLMDGIIITPPTLKYTARIVKMEFKIIKDKKKSYPIYYLYFYDYTNKLNQYTITKEEYQTWKKGDAIETTLQPTTNSLFVQNVIRLDNFEGQTDMEIDMDKYKRDVELFGQSQNEKKGSLESKKNLYYIVYFVVLGLLDYIICNIKLTNKELVEDKLFILLSDDVMFNICAIIALCVTVLVVIIEFKKIKGPQYTLEESRIWKDNFLPRCLIYFLATYIFVGAIILFFHTGIR